MYNIEIFFSLYKICALQLYPAQEKIILCEYMLLSNHNIRLRLEEIVITPNEKMNGDCGSATIYYFHSLMWKLDMMHSLQKYTVFVVKTSSKGGFIITVTQKNCCETKLSTTLMSNVVQIQEMDRFVRSLVKNKKKVLCSWTKKIAHSHPSAGMCVYGEMKK